MRRSLAALVLILISFSASAQTADERTAAWARNAGQGEPLMRIGLHAEHSMEIGTENVRPGRTNELELTLERIRCGPHRGQQEIEKALDLRSGGQRGGEIRLEPADRGSIGSGPSKAILVVTDCARPSSF